MKRRSVKRDDTDDKRGEDVPAAVAEPRPRSGGVARAFVPTTPGPIRASASVTRVASPPATAPSPPGRKKAIRTPIQGLLPSGKLLILCYRLPVRVHWCEAAAAWAVRWDETSFLSRSPEGSIADELPTLWLGMLTPHCFEASAGGDAPCCPARAFASGSVMTPDYELHAGLLKDPSHQASLKAALGALGVIPIFLADPASYQDFEVLCQLILQPMLHNVLEGATSRIDPVSYSDMLESGWAVFERVSCEIVDAVLVVYKHGDALWFHDYHTALLADGIVKRTGTRPPMVLFIHSPFPASEVLRAMPFRTRWLEAILSNDVVVFHTFAHARHFLQCCRRILGLACQSQQGGRIGVSCRGGRSVMVAINQVGVEKHALNSAMMSEQAATHVCAIRGKHRGKVILFSFSDSDRLSGVALKLLAYEKFLQEHSSYPKTVVLIQKVVASHSNVRDLTPDGESLLETNRTIVKRIHETFGEHVLDYEEATSFSRAIQTALYYCCDVLLHTPVQEGMNLLPLEYVYCRTEWSRAVEDDLNPLSLLHGGDPAAHIAAIERSLAAQAEASISPARPSKLSEIPECEELCEDDTDVMVDPAPQGKGLPMSMLAPSKSNQLLSSFAPHLVVDPSSPVASSRPVEFQLPPQDTDVRVPLPFLPRLGVVVLSEFCISAQIMNSHLSVNPWNIDDVAKAIEKALLMEDEERFTRHLRDSSNSSRRTCSHVVKTVLADLLRLRQSDRIVFTDIDCGGLITPLRPMVVSNADDAELSPLDISMVLHAFATTRRRVILLDYDGALIPHNSISWYVQQQFAESSGGSGASDSSDGLSLPPSLVSHLYSLAGNPTTTVYVLSATRVAAVDGSLCSRLEGVGLATEDDGIHVFDPDESPDVVLDDDSTFQGNPLRTYPPPKLADLQVPEGWANTQQKIVAVMNEYKVRVAGSRVIVTESCVTWDFRLSESDWGTSQSKFLAEALSAAFESPLVKVARRVHQVDVMLRNFGIASALQELLRVIDDAEFVLAVGNDTNDEEMFTTLNDLLATVKKQSDTAHGSMKPPLSSATGAAVEKPVLPSFMGGPIPSGLAMSFLSHPADPISVPVAKPSVADKRVFTLTIGRRRTNARYYVNSVQDVYGLFQTLAVSDARRRRVSSLTKVINRSSSIPMVSPPIPKPLSSSGLSVGTHSSSVNSSGSLAPPAVSSPADYSVPFRWADTEDVSTAGIGFAQMTSSHLLQQPMFTFPAPPPVPPKDADTGPP